MTNRLTLSVLLVALSITLVWAFRPEQNALERLTPAELRQPLSAQPGGAVDREP